MCYSRSTPFYLFICTYTLFVVSVSSDAPSIMSPFFGFAQRIAHGSSFHRMMPCSRSDSASWEYWNYREVMADGEVKYVQSITRKEVGNQWCRNSGWSRVKGQNLFPTRYKTHNRPVQNTCGIMRWSPPTSEQCGITGIFLRHMPLRWWSKSVRVTTGLAVFSTKNGSQSDRIKPCWGSNFHYATSWNALLIPSWWTGTNHITMAQRSYCRLIILNASVRVGLTAINWRI